MSVVAQTNIGHNHMASVPLNSEPSVTAISVSARIDYIQRFSKQAVLVIDNDVTVYTQAARQFLINFSSEQSTQETNVAFVSASTKLNDIQMRCRLIEQLFANTLFDPEKSLAVSILNLSKQSKDSINIIVEHAHALSLQIKYELCQLVDVANKTHSKINVVLFGLEQAAQDAAVNKSIFKNKLSIVDAKSGQLFSLDHAKFTGDKSMLTNKFWLKIVTTVIVISALIGLSWYGLIHYDDFSLSKLAVVNVQSKDNRVIESNTKQQKDVANVLVTEDTLAIKNSAVLAETSDIEAALLGKSLTIEKANYQQAQTTDILQALDMSEELKTISNDVLVTHTSEPNTVKSLQFTSSEEEVLAPKPLMSNKAVSIESIEEVSKQIAPDQEIALSNVSQPITAKITVSQNNTAALPFELTPEYYSTASAGYVVQLVGFRNKTLLSRFIDKYPNLEYFSYQKNLNGQPLIILTTAIFDTKLQANAAIQTLPQEIINKGVWIKPLSLVQTEMKSL